MHIIATSTTTTTLARASRRAFSIIELLVVIGIIALLISILLPALSGVRDAARVSATTSLANDVVNASIAFQTDHRRLPGYFDQRTLGSDSDGFTNSENVLIDLAGGIVETTTTPAADNSFVEVHPADDTNSVIVNNDLVGTDRAGGGYLNIKADNLRVIEGQNDRALSIDTANTKDNTSMVDIVDYWGMPLLIFTRDEASGSQPENFALINASSDANPTAAEQAWFYWQSNAGYLNSSRLGPKSKNQQISAPPSPRGGSLLGSAIGAPDDPHNEDLVRRTMEAVLGSPSYPRWNTDPPIGSARVYPTAPRGGVVVISAGPSNVYFFHRQRVETDLAIGFGDRVPIPGGDRLETGEQLRRFDDIILAGAD